MYEQLHDFLLRPEPFSRITTSALWTTPHLSEQMLAYHLNESTDLASRKPEGIRSITDWIDSRLALEGKRVCDLGCGPGLYAKAFADKGAAVTGIDFSASSIEFAREQSQSDERDITYLLRDYLRDELPTGFDVVTLIYFDYCVIPLESREILLKRIGEMLGPGGYFVLDVLGAEGFETKAETVDVESNLMDGFWSANDYIGLQRTYLYDDLLLSLDRYLIVEETQTWEVFNWLQHFTLESITSELASAGFEVLHKAGSLKGDKLQASSESIGLVARKK